MQIAPHDEKRIAEAIRAAEQKTSGEIFCVMASASSQYEFVPIARAALIAIVLPLPLYFLTHLWWDQIYYVQLAAFIGLSILFSLPWLRHPLVPRRVKRARASAEAKKQFAAHGLHLTDERTGVLIFASVAERYVEIIADSGINNKVPQEVWDKAVTELINAIKRGEPVEGFVRAVEICGAVLAEHFPPGKINLNELPDKLIVI
jgi:putative membrane protein